MHTVTTAKFVWEIMQHCSRPGQCALAMYLKKGATDFVPLLAFVVLACWEVRIV